MGKLIIRLTFAVYIYYLIRILIFKGDRIISSLSAVFKNYNWYLPDTDMNFIPFKTILMYLTGREFTILILLNVLGNIAVFIPFGLILSLAFNKTGRFFVILLLSMAASVFIEACQFFFMIGSADIDDLILNTLGGVIGYAIFLQYKKYAYKKKREL